MYINNQSVLFET